MNREAVLTARARLAADLREALRAGRGAEVLQDFLDTFPLAAMIDDCMARWDHGLDGHALAVVARAAAVTGEPLPSAHPDVLRVAVEDLPKRRAELAHKLAVGQIAAVDVVGEATTPEQHLALGEIRLEGDAQARFERFGAAALHLARVPDFSEVIGAPPSGKPGTTLKTQCTAAALPGTPADLRAGRTRPVAYLLFDGPYRPIPAQTQAMPLLAAFQHGATLEAAASKLETTPLDIEPAVVELVRIGALSA